MPLITLQNYATTLKESTQSRSGTPDGNIFFDTANDRIELITKEELPQIDFGSGPVENPLNNADGITLQALYAFERLRRRVNTGLRKFLPGIDGQFQYAGAWIFDNGVKLASGAGSSTGDDRTKIRQSGWIERSASGAIDRIYFGVRSLNEIQPTSLPYIQLAASLSEADLLAAAPIPASRPGPLDEAFQVYGSTANGDTTAGNFDYTTSRILIAKVRTFGYTQGEATSTGSGVSTLQGYSAGFGLGENISPVSTFTLSNVYGGSAIAPFTGMLFTRHSTPQTRTGFNEGNGQFTDIISNTGNGSLAQIRARMDAWMQLDTDIDTNGGGFRPKRAAPLYTVNDSGQIVTRKGLFIDNVPIADRQSIIFTANDGTTRTYPFSVEVNVAVSDAWVNDPKAWYQCMFKDGSGTNDFNTSGAVIVNDASGNPVVGTRSDAIGSAGNYKIRFSFDYDGNNQAGLPAGTDKTLVFLAEGDGGAQAAYVEINITRQPIITAQALSEKETNI